jgi:hypothetical protein
MTVRRVDNLKVADLDSVRLRNLADFCRRADENRPDEPLLAGLDRTRQRRFLAGMGDSGRHRLEASTSSEQRFVLSRSRRSIHDFLGQWLSPAAELPVRFLSGRTSEEWRGPPNNGCVNVV